MRSFIQKHSVEILFVVVMLLCGALIGSTAILLNGYSEGLESQARTQVALYAEDTRDLLETRVSELCFRVDVLARKLSGLQSESESILLLRDEEMDQAYYGDILTVRFFNYNEAEQKYDEFEEGYPFEGNEAETVLALLGSETVACAGVSFDHETLDRSVVSFYAPVRDNPNMQAIVVMYPLSEIVVFTESANTEYLEKSDFVLFCSQNGRVKSILHSNNDTFANQVLSVFNKEDETVSKYDPILQILEEKINDDDAVKRLDEMIRKGETDVMSVMINGVSYVVSVSGGGESTGGMYVLGMYLSSSAYESGYDFANAILATLVVCFLVLIVAMAYLLISRRNINRRIDAFDTVNPTLDCPTVLKYNRDAAELISAHKATQYAVVIAEVRFFNYITENFGSEAAFNVLKYIKLICSKSMRTDELYAFHSDGQYVLLLHYRTQSDLEARLKGISSIAYKYTGLRSEKYSIKMAFGVYEVDRTHNVPVQNMIDMAIEAKNSAKDYGTNGLIKYYTEKIRENYIQNADIEVRMENALKNDEFKVFFQPKYNLTKAKQDGCEALVRWYEPEQNVYRRPDTFLPLFEANGFITEVDHYVFLKVCEYIKESTERGQTVFPVSVNVSRITAIQPNFIEYYTRTKRQNHIPNNFIMLEFTESFAYENYDALKGTIEELHRNGFLCSIDDFGTGFSSYNILKELPMDEIKLDKFFLDKGISETRDNSIIQSVITVAKELNMKVTQEGVETVEDLRRLRKMGCDVIQGYYYAKPLPMVDYIAFVNAKDVSQERKHMES